MAKRRLIIKPKAKKAAQETQETQKSSYKKCTKVKVLKAIPGSGGLLSRIAERLCIGAGTLSKNLRKEGWEDVRAELQLEKDRVGDIAEETVQDAIRQRLDMSTASVTARWYLERKHSDRGFKDKKELTIEGGTNPLHIKNETFIRLEELNLDLETRKAILASIEEKAEEQKEKPQPK